MHPRNAGALAPPRGLPLQAAAEPPRGRVLIADDRAETALALQKLLRELGYRVVGPAESPADVSRLLERRPHHWPIDCALINARMPDASYVAVRLRGRGVPVVWILPGEESSPSIVLPEAPAVHTPTDAETLSRTIREARDHPRAPAAYPTPPPQEAWPRVFPQL